MRLPHQKYVVYLLSSGVAGDDINEIMEQGGFPPVDEVSLNKLEREYPYISQQDIPIQARKLGIYFLYNRTEPVKEAFSSLNSPYRHAMEVLLTGRVPTWDIISIINDRYGISPSEESICAYAQYFWDVRGIKSDDFYKYVNEYKTVRAESRDLWVAWEQGPPAAKSRMGRTGDIDSEAVMEDVFESSYINYVSVAREDPLCDDVGKAASRWSKILFDSHRIRSLEGMALGRILAAIERFVVRNDPVALQQLLTQKDPAANIAGMDGKPLYDGDPRDIRIEDLEAIASILGPEDDDVD